MARVVRAASRELDHVEIRFKASCFLRDDRAMASVGVALETQDAYAVDAREREQHLDSSSPTVPEKLAVAHLALSEAAVLPELADLLGVAERSIRLVGDPDLAEGIEQRQRGEPRLP